MRLKHRGCRLHLCQLILFKVELLQFIVHCAQAKFEANKKKYWGTGHYRCCETDARVVGKYIVWSSEPFQKSFVSKRTSKLMSVRSAQSVPSQGVANQKRERQKKLRRTRWRAQITDPTRRITQLMDV
jgi:hypothetical protein